MGHSEVAKRERRQVRKVLGDETAFWAFECFNIIKVRGFWGRMKWLFTGK
jgi:hypothetical protein